MSVDRRREAIEPEHPGLSVVRQCELVSIACSTFYRCPTAETPLNLALMRLIDEQFLATPWYGSRQMMQHLRREGHGGVGRIVLSILRGSFSPRDGPFALRGGVSQAGSTIISLQTGRDWIVS